MNRKLCLMASLFAAVALSFAWAQSKERTGEIGDTGKPASPPPSMKLEGVKGKILGVAATKELLLKTDSGYLVVKVNEEDWKQELGRGDEIVVTGGKVSKEPFGTEVEAAKVTLVTRADKRPDPIGLRSIAEIQGMRFGDRPVITHGAVQEFSGSRAKIADGGSSIWLEFGTTEVRDRYAYATGAEILVIGELKVLPADKQVNVIAIRPFSILKQPGEPSEVQAIAAVLKERPMGKVVKVRGHVGMFVGDSNVTLLYQDNNVLAVYPSEKFVAMDLPAGEEAEAVGTFDVMQYRDREVGVLREARILPSRTTKQVERAQEKK